MGLTQTPRLSAWPQPYLLGGKTQGLLFPVTASAASVGGEVGLFWPQGPQQEHPVVFLSWTIPGFTAICFILIQ